MKVRVVVPIMFYMLIVLVKFVYCGRPTVVNVGAIFTFNSVIGKVAKTAMEIAVSDVNADPRILNGTELRLIPGDAECNAFVGSVRAFQILENGVVAIIGPQSSSIAHMLSQIANGFHVPLISYAATDPTLSALQFPYFIRATHSDLYQMTAMADLIEFYEWKEVIVFFLDNDYGRNAISVLVDQLAKKMIKISYKFPLPHNFDPNFISNALNQSRNLGPRVYVVHINPDPMMRFFSIAQELNMMTSDYVWLATDWLSSTLDAFPQENQNLSGTVEGVIVLRPYTPETTLKKTFMSRWRGLQQRHLVDSNLNAYGLYAYDAVWAIAHSIDKLLEESNNISFSPNLLHNTKTDELQLGDFRVFDSGERLLKILSDINFTGLTGRIQFDAKRNLLINGYEIMNIAQMAMQKVGYWSLDSGLSSTPETHKQVKHSPLDQKKLDNVIWPGGTMTKPRGWVVASNEKPYRIGIPKRASFKEFVTESGNSHKIQGYCIDLFDEARKQIPYEVPFIYVPFGNGVSNPNYDELVKLVANGTFDAAIGDIAIVTNRTRIVDFTQPYISTGLVIVAPVDSSKSSAWVFLKPFTLQLWVVIALSFVIIAVVIWILEHRVNDDFRGPPKRQIITMFLFSFSTLFKTNQEDTVSTLGRMVMMVWLFLLLVITSSYTASLTSILTVQQLKSSITGIDSLISTNWPIGYQVGSFAQSYLIDNLNVHKSRLVSLGSPEEYEDALRKGLKHGGVAAIVDELPYIELFLMNRDDFRIVGQPFTKSGWGFAFQKDSPLAIDMSTAILKLSENGKMQEIHKKWFCESGICPTEKRRDPDPNHLHLNSFWGLYLLCGVASIVALALFLSRAVGQYVRYKKRQMEAASTMPDSSDNKCSRVIFNFFDFIDEKEEAIKRFFNHQNDSQPQVVVNSQ